MRTVKNYYFILGLSRGASLIEIKAAYESIKAVAAYDEFQASMMDEVTEAYECLIDTCRKEAYDAELGAPPQVSVSGGNVHNFKSAESGASLDMIIVRERKKQQSKRRLIQTVVTAVIFLCVVGGGMNYIMRRSEERTRQVANPADLFRVNKPKPAPPPEPQSPAEVIESVVVSKPVIRHYDIQSGGVVVTDRSVCRSQPSSSSRETAVMRKDTVIFASKEMRDTDGSVWFYVSNSQFAGWANGRDIHVYKF
jgi:hypothetical protein